ncbi:hypothetical protein [Alkalihalobacillus deserti]|uniref:hypothetical protein n=1 Tax=Alkalihalobacillus deserti TaxID=2879466 RepID=UPI001D15B110|nr:hypothetical protein [Alkalihalobacillus deserti]
MDKYEKAYLLYQEGLVQFENDNFENALDCFNKSNKLDEHSRTFARIYECLIKLGRKEEAKPFIKTAYLQNPKQDKVTIQYAESLIEDGNVLLAKEILENLLLRNSTYNPAKRLLDKMTK